MKSGSGPCTLRETSIPDGPTESAKAREGGPLGVFQE